MTERTTHYTIHSSESVLRHDHAHGILVAEAIFHRNGDVKQTIFDLVNPAGSLNPSGIKITAEDFGWAIAYLQKSNHPIWAAETYREACMGMPNSARIVLEGTIKQLGGTVPTQHPSTNAPLR
jgi:hypothetical protein